MGPKALTRMVKLWPEVSPHKRHRYPCSPQTSEQEAYVRDWIPATKINATFEWEPHMPNYQILLHPESFAKLVVNSDQE